MKDGKAKGIIAVLILLLAIVGVVVYVFKDKNKEKDTFKDASTEVKEKATKVFEYLFYSTKGYTSKFGGTDLLFSKDKIEVKDISDASKLKVATNYVMKNSSTSVSNATIEQVVKTENISENEYTFYEGKDVRDAIKTLFGIDFKNLSVIGENTYKYDYIYFEKYDLYGVRNNPNYVSDDGIYDVYYKILNTKTDEDGKIKIEFVIAYVYIDSANGVVKYSTKSDASDFVYELENVAWLGPIVMNTKQEIIEAFTELEKGTFIKAQTNY